jgi:UDP-N-acetylmuramoyl-tripeptide--D-alanyl-D-alanine ligase
VAIVDDAYNASPGSVRAALELLSGLPGRRIAVLGEMLELGSEADEGHRGVGEVAAGIVDLLVVVGDGAAAIAAGAAAAGLVPDRIVRVADPAGAVDHLRHRLRGGDVVLVKASRGIALERVVEGLREALGATAPPDPRTDGGRR